MSGVILDPVTSPESIEANFQRLNEALVALQGGSIALSQIVGYEDLVTSLELQDELTAVRQENEKLKVKVGDIIITTTDADPAEERGYGTWELTSAGRTLIGHGKATDSRGEEREFTGGDEDGEYQHKLTVNELPKFRVTIKNVFTPGGGGGYDSGPGHNPRTVQSEPIGGDAPHNIMQPYLVVYFWKRVA